MKDDDSMLVIEWISSMEGCSEDGGECGNEEDCNSVIENCKIVWLIYWNLSKMVKDLIQNYFSLYNLIFIKSFKEPSMGGYT